MDKILQPPPTLNLFSNQEIGYLLFLLGFVTAGCASPGSGPAGKTWTVTSPDGSNVVRVQLDEGTLSYFVERKGAMVL